MSAVRSLVLRLIVPVLAISCLAPARSAAMNDAPAAPPFTAAERKTIARYVQKVKTRDGVSRLTEGDWAVEMPESAPATLAAELAVYLERVDAFMVRRLGVKRRFRTQPTLVVFPTQEAFLDEVNIVGRTAFFRAWVDRAPLGLGAGRGKKGATETRGEYHVYTGFLEGESPSLAAIDLTAVRREVVRAVLYAAASGNLIEAFWYDRGASQRLATLDPFGPDDAPVTPPALVGEPRPSLVETFGLRPEVWVADNETMLVHDAIAESLFTFLESEAGEPWRKKVLTAIGKLRSGEGALLDDRSVRRLEPAWHAWLEEQDSDSE